MIHPNRKTMFVLILLAAVLTACSMNQGNPAASSSANTPVSFIPTPAHPSEPSAAVSPTPIPTPQPPEFDAQRAYADVEHQAALGPRIPGSQAHAQVIDWMQSELSENGWAVELQSAVYMNQQVTNVIAKRGTGQTPWVIIGAHYDSRFAADRDPDSSRKSDPVPGANDGASGVAVLMELSRVLPNHPDKQIWLVFFDAEDQGDIPGWDWILGSRAFVESLSGRPDSVIIIDMIGDADLNIYKERNSDPGLTDEIWQTAAEQGYAGMFIPEYGFSILDDHTPFLEKGLRAIDIIDFNYPYWHTVEDTPDKVSAQSLRAVGDTLLRWLLKP